MPRDHRAVLPDQDRIGEPERPDAPGNLGHLRRAAGTTVVLTTSRAILAFALSVGLSAVAIRARPQPLPELGSRDHVDFNEVFFDGVVVPRDHLVGERGMGFYYAMMALDFERITAEDIAGWAM